LLPIKVAEERSVEVKMMDWLGDGERWGSSLRKELFASLGPWMWWHCAPQLSVWWHDRAGSGDAYLDRYGSDGNAAGICRTERDGADAAGGESVFRSEKRSNLIKLLWWDCDGLCLLAKRLERGRFIWPQAASATVSLTPAQLSTLLEGIAWRRPVRSSAPQMAV
jgi:transposase